MDSTPSSFIPSALAMPGCQTLPYKQPKFRLHTGPGMAIPPADATPYPADARPLQAPAKGPAMNSSYNQRVFTRVDTTVSVTTEPSAGIAFDAEMIELSAGGMSLEHAPMLPPGTPVVCFFFTTSQHLITLRGIVSWARDGRLGIQFTGYDTASYNYFKEFLLEQASDPHAVENEMQLNLDTLPEAD